MNSTDFRAALVKIMPGYRWTVHKTSNPERLTATGIQSSGFNRLSTLQVIWDAYDKAWGGEVYEAKSAGHGTKSPWEHTNKDRTLARTLRGLQTHYERSANAYRQLASRLQAGRALVASEPAPGCHQPSLSSEDAPQAIMDDHNGIVGETPMSILRRIRATTTRLLNEGDAEIAALRAKLDAANADAERLAEALIWASGSPDFNDGGQAEKGWRKVARPALAAHEARKRGA